MLIAVRDYLQAHPQATLAELGIEFRTSPQVMKEMLFLLERKGVVRSASAVSCQGCRQSCSDCPVGVNEAR